MAGGFFRFQCGKLFEREKSAIRRARYRGERLAIFTDAFAFIAAACVLRDFDHARKLTSRARATIARSHRSVDALRHAADVALHDGMDLANSQGATAGDCGPFARSPSIP